MSPARWWVTLCAEWHEKSLGETIPFLFVTLTSLVLLVNVLGTAMQESGVGYAMEDVEKLAHRAVRFLSGGDYRRTRLECRTRLLLWTAMLQLIEFTPVLAFFIAYAMNGHVIDIGNFHYQFDGIYSAIRDNALLSKWAGGLGNDWTPVRALGSEPSLGIRRS